MPTLRDNHPVQLVDAAAVLDSKLTDNASPDGGLSFDILLMPACRLCRTDGLALPVRVDLVEVVPQVGLLLFQRSHRWFSHHLGVGRLDAERLADAVILNGESVVDRCCRC